MNPLRDPDWGNPRSVAAWWLWQSRRLHEAHAEGSPVTSREDNNRIFEFAAFLRGMAGRIALRYEERCPHCERRRQRWAAAGKAPPP